MKQVKTYEMEYDDKSRGDCGNGCDGFLGEFKVIQEIFVDGWRYDYIGLNIETNQICMITSREVCGYGGGMASFVTVLYDLQYCGDNETTHEYGVIDGGGTGIIAVHSEEEIND